MMSNRNVRKCVIIPEISKEEFLREVWISLTKEDAPKEIFNNNFSDIYISEYQIIRNDICVDTTYEVSIGYDRQEPYIDTEVYYEKEPYIGYETYYESEPHTEYEYKNTWNNDLHKYVMQYVPVTKYKNVKKERQVTKYKDIRKERPVTRYRTVTDWSPYNGIYSAKSTAIVNNSSGKQIDIQDFINHFNKTKKSSIIDKTSNEVTSTLAINYSVQDTINNEHRKNISQSIAYSLPGDRYRGLSWNITNTTSNEITFYIMPEYSVSITYEGKTYTKKGIPFGDINITGDKIANEISFDEIKKRMKRELDNDISMREQSIDNGVWNKTKQISFITMALLVSSIVVSCFVRNYLISRVVFAFSIAVFFFNKINIKAKKKEIKEMIKKENEAQSERVEKEIANYADNYKNDQKKLLNEKLESLGLKTLSPSDF